MTAEPRVATGAGSPGPDVARPEIAVPPQVLVVSLGAAREAGRAARLRALTREWLDLDRALDLGLARHRDQLEGLLQLVVGPARLGVVAAFLSFRGCRDGSREGRPELVGGAAVLSLELLERLAGSPEQRAERIAAGLRRASWSVPHLIGPSEVRTGRTTSGVPAARVRFRARLGDGSDPGCAALGPLVNICRWLYPVPDHPDLVWALAHQTTDLAEAEDLVAEFDQLAASLSWSGTDG